MLFGPSLACDVADDHSTPVPGMAVAVVVAVEEQRAIGEVARRPQPEELVEIALRRRLRLARADRADAPAPVAGARPVGSDCDALAGHPHPTPTAPLLRPARVHQ